LFILLEKMQEFAAEMILEDVVSKVSDIGNDFDELSQVVKSKYKF